LTSTYLNFIKPNPAVYIFTFLRYFPIKVVLATQSLFNLLAKIHLEHTKSRGIYMNVIQL